MRTFAVTAVLLLISALQAQPPKDTPKDDKLFDDISHKQIKELVEKARKDGKLGLDGSDTKANQIPQGTILCYITSDKQYGKLKVVEYGYNLKLKWVTYAKDGSVVSKGDSLVVRGTWSCDLDKGVEGDEDTAAKDDFWWEQKTETARSLTFSNGAVFTVFPVEKK